MKMVWRILVLIWLLSLLTEKEVCGESSLQSRINSTPLGGTIHLKKGSYRERILVEKSINIEAETGTILKLCSAKPLITIKGENVKINGITIESCKNSSGPAVYITGRKHQMKNLSIHSRGTAVKMVNAEQTSVKNLKITGKEQERGIDLWQSNFNTFKGIELDHVQDGFYMENSYYNTFIQNKVSNSRYGFHVMFSDNITIKNNVSFRNYSGAMIMGTHNTLIDSNQLTDNNQNVNAQGLLLYDVHQSTVRGNLIANNRVGMYLEDSSENILANNRIFANFIGTQMNNISNNKILHNSFVSNVSELQALKCKNNSIHSNYWDAASKLDTNGDGKSNLPYQADPYFLNLIGETPEFQLFCQDPGMLLLQKILKSPEKKLITDESPLMKNELNTKTNAYANTHVTLIFSLMMIAGSLLMIVKGRKGF